MTSLDRTCEWTSPFTHWPFGEVTSKRSAQTSLRTSQFLRTNPPQDMCAHRSSRLSRTLQLTKVMDVEHLPAILLIELRSHSCPALLWRRVRSVPRRGHDLLPSSGHVASRNPALDLSIFPIKWPWTTAKQRQRTSLRHTQRPRHTFLNLTRRELA